MGASILDDRIAALGRSWLFEAVADGWPAHRIRRDGSTDSPTALDLAATILALPRPQLLQCLLCDADEAACLLLAEIDLELCRPDAEPQPDAVAGGERQAPQDGAAASLRSLFAAWCHDNHLPAGLVREPITIRRDVP